MPMEGAQEFNIPLDTNLEIESETTVVNAGSPTFIYKPEEKYNNLLGNSVKYEDDGWFIDWKRIRLTNGTVGAIDVTPPDFKVSTIQMNSQSGVTGLGVGFDNGLSFSVVIDGGAISGLDGYTRVDNELHLFFEFKNTPSWIILDANTFKMKSHSENLIESVFDIVVRYNENVISGYIQNKKVYNQYIDLQQPSIEVQVEDESGNLIPSSYKIGDYETYELDRSIRTHIFNDLLTVETNSVDEIINDGFGTRNASEMTILDQSDKEKVKLALKRNIKGVVGHDDIKNSGLVFSAFYKSQVIHYRVPDGKQKSGEWEYTIRKATNMSDFSVLPYFVFDKINYVGELYKYTDIIVRWTNGASSTPTVHNPVYWYQPLVANTDEYTKDDSPYVLGDWTWRPGVTVPPTEFENDAYIWPNTANTEKDTNITIANADYHPNYSLDNPDYKPMFLPDGTQNPDYDPTIPAYIYDPAYDGKPYLRNSRYSPGDEIRNPDYDPTINWYKPNEDYDPPMLYNNRMWFIASMNQNDIIEAGYEGVDVHVKSEVYSLRYVERVSEETSNEFVTKAISYTNYVETSAIPHYMKNPDYDLTIPYHIYNDAYDPRYEIYNPLYDPEVYVYNPDYDPSIPVWIYDPTGTHAIDNPDYKPMMINNPDYNTTSSILNPAYDPVLYTRNPDWEYAPLLVANSNALPPASMQLNLDLDFYSETQVRTGDSTQSSTTYVWAKTKWLHKFHIDNVDLGQRTYNKDASYPAGLKIEWAEDGSNYMLVRPWIQIKPSVYGIYQHVLFDTKSYIKDPTAPLITKTFYDEQCMCFNVSGLPYIKKVTPQVSMNSGSLVLTVGWADDVDFCNKDGESVDPSTNVSMNLSVYRTWMTNSIQQIQEVNVSGKIHEIIGTNFHDVELGEATLEGIPGYSFTYTAMNRENEVVELRMSEAKYNAANVWESGPIIYFIQRKKVAPRQVNDVDEVKDNASQNTLVNGTEITLINETGYTIYEKTEIHGDTIPWNAKIISRTYAIGYSYAIEVFLVNVKLLKRFLPYPYNIRIDSATSNLDSTPLEKQTWKKLAMVFYVPNFVETEVPVTLRGNSWTYTGTENVWAWGTKNRVYLQEYFYHAFRANPIGTYRASKPVGFIGDDDTYKVSFMYNDKEYALTLSGDAAAEYQWYSKDIRTGKERLLHNTKSPEYIIHRSHWNDSEERLCWVVDDSTMIIVGFADEVCLWKKTGEPDIGQRYEWKKEATVRFSDWNLGIRYGISDAIENRPYIWGFYWIDQKTIAVRYAEAPLTSDTFKELEFTEVAVEIEDAPSNYNFEESSESIAILPPYITAEELWNICRITSTRKGNQLWMGIFVDKGLKQWVLKITGDTAFVLNGFGFVGIDGTITGGQYPELFSVEGTRIVDAEKGFVAVLSDWDIAHYEFSDGINQPSEFDLSKDEGSVLGSVMYSGGTAYFLGSFDNLVIGIDPNSNTLIKIPALQRCSLISVGASGDVNDTAGKVQDMNEILLYGRVGRLGTSAELFAEAASCTWKSMNDISEGEEKIEYSNKINKNVNISTSAYGIASLGAALAGAAVSSALTGTPLSSMGPSLEGAAREEMKEQVELSNRLSSSTGEIKVAIHLSDFYGVGAESHIFAGPGFVQTQIAKSASLQATGVASRRYLEEGIGLDPRTFIFIPGIVVGTSTGTSAYFNPWGPPTLYGFSSGLLTAGIAKLLPYRKYGYSHRYINYPTKEVYTYDLYDFEVVVDKVEGVDMTPATGVPSQMQKSISTTETVVIEPEDILFTGDTKVENRMSIIEGSTMSATDLEVARKSTVSNTNLQFSNPFVYDYCVNKDHELYYTAIDSEIVAVSIKDTKVLDGEPTNVVILTSKVLIGSSYCGLEIDDPSSYNMDNLRPRAVTPQTLLLNQTGYNCIHGDRVYHACDAYSNRVIKGSGGDGMDIEVQNSIYTYRADDDFKISSIYPPMSVFGKFSSAFTVAYDWLIEHKTPFYKSLKSDVEVAETARFSIPVMFNRLAILPAVGKTLAAYKFNVVEGVTSLVTDLRTTHPEARRPDALDFPIYGQIYRWNPEYISSVTNEMGVQSIKDLVATIGLIYVGSTPDAAWFYSEALRSFYKFQPTTVHRVMNADRYKKVRTGTYDFVGQEVVFDPLTSRGREMVRNTSEKFIGNIFMPNETIGPLERDDAFEFYSMAGGLVMQGLRRFQISRFLITDDMTPAIKKNMGKWKRVPGAKISDFWKQRKYDWSFDFGWAPTDRKVVSEWYMEPFKLATAFLGIDDYSESKFQWLINFALSDIMLDVLGNRYITVYLAAETMTVGGVVESSVQRIRLHRTMFARQGQYGYYSYKYNANNGIGDSERLYLWTDGPIFLRSLKLEAASKTSKRTSVMADYAETQGMVEF